MRATALAAVARAGRLPIVVGGTGLYFKALTQGLAAVPPIPAGIRSAVRDRLKVEGIASLYAELSDRDPATRAASRAGDRAPRHPRARGGLGDRRSITDWHSEGMEPALAPDSAVKIFLDADRAGLYRRIDARFDAMLEAGALEEVRALSLRALDAALPAMKAHGVPWLIRSLKGEIDLAQAAEEGKRDTRRYTKRQATWFRHQLPDWTWVRPRHGAGGDPAAARALTCGLLSPDGECGDCKAGGKHPPGRPHLRVDVEMGQQHAPRVDAAREHVDERFADRGHSGPPQRREAEAQAGVTSP